MRMAHGFLTTPDGVRLYYRTLGDGPPTLLIPNGFHLLPDLAVLTEHRRLVIYDARRRGRSDAVALAPSEGAIHRDADDLEAVRGYFGLEAIDLLAHSYSAFIAVLHALGHGDHVRRIVLVGPMEPRTGALYPPHLTGADDTLVEVLKEMSALGEQRSAFEPRDFCEKAWSVLRRLYVVDPAHAHRVDWGRCDLPNERAFLAYWTGSLQPSIQRLRLDRSVLATIRPPVLVVHGTRDRSAPYGGGREWALWLPNARLLTIREAGHAPWIEAPDAVLAGVEAFLDGQWPAGAEIVEALEPAD